MSSDLARATGYRKRFASVYVALAIIAGAGIGAMVILAVSPDASPSVAPAWSKFAPSGSTDSRARQIADKVSTRYRFPGGAQMAGAIPGPLTLTSSQPEGSTQILVRAIAIQPNVPTGGELSDRDLRATDTSNSLQYVLCGYGAQCSIANGAPSDARYLLLRREALELALHTFKYLGNIESVVVFLPPPLIDGQQRVAPSVVYFERDDFATELEQPLIELLDPKTPTVGEVSDTEEVVVNEITRPRLYQFGYAQAQDGGAILLLDPVTTAP